MNKVRTDRSHQPIKSPQGSQFSQWVAPTTGNGQKVVLKPQLGYLLASRARPSCDVHSKPCISSPDRQRQSMRKKKFRNVDDEQKNQIFIPIAGFPTRLGASIHSTTNVASCATRTNVPSIVTASYLHRCSDCHLEAPWLRGLSDRQAVQNRIQVFGEDKR